MTDLRLIDGFAVAPDPTADTADLLADLLRRDPMLACGIGRELRGVAWRLEHIDAIKVRGEFWDAIAMIEQLGARRSPRVPRPVPLGADTASFGEEFVSVRTAADALGWSTSYTRRMARSRRLPAVRADGVWWVRRDALPAADTTEETETA